MTVDRERIRRAVLAATIGLVLGAIGYVVAGSSMLAAGLVFAITALMAFSVPTDSGMRYSLSLAAVAAAPLVLWDDRTGLHAVEVITVVVLGTVGAQATSALVRRQLRRNVISLARHLVDAGLFVAVFVVLMELPYASDPAASESGPLMLAISAAVITWFCVDVALWAITARRGSRQTWGHFVKLAMRGWPVAASVLATGVFFGIAWRATHPWWALVVAAMPYAFAHIAFHRAHETRRTYRQTIRALSRIPEVSALSPDGHGDRTAALAMEIASEIGLSPGETQDLEFASQMHDIGRITLNQPSILRMGFTDEDIARWGSEMVAEVPYLDNVSELVLKQHEPYRRPGEQKDPDLPMGAKIIKAASAYDHATTELGFMPVEALEVLHRGAAYDYDPDVVGAIRAVLERQEAV